MIVEVLEELVLGPALNDFISPFLDEHAGFENMNLLSRK